MAELILARHGQTLWNVDKIYRGRSDVDLDEVGTRQAELLGKYLSNYGLEAIYSSPLKRALDTANIIARYQKIEVQIAENLVDFDYGEWQCLPEQEVKKLYPALLKEWRNIGSPSGCKQSLDMLFTGTGQLSFLEYQAGCWRNHGFQLLRWPLHLDQAQ